MRYRHVLFLLFMILLLAVTVTGCKRDTVEDSPADIDTSADDRTAPPPARPDPQKTEVEDPGFKGQGFEEDDPDPPTDLDAAHVNATGVLRTIYFAYDSSELTDLARQSLRANGEWLKAHPEFGVVIEGHCDERGTIEYNLELGQRRASSVRDYLVTLGVARPRVRAVSYGEERPVGSGNDEAAWSRNRRAEFKAE